MTTILFCVTPTPGHVNPLLLIAKHLRSRGHTILFQCADVFQRQIEAAGLQFTPLEGLGNHDYRESKTIWPSPEEIHKAVHTILGDAAFHRRANELKASFGRYNALETTAEIVELTLSTRAVQVS
jgi:UDP:flavonoid glycosyltransferase YjiC (YdhE family)